MAAIASSHARVLAGGIPPLAVRTFSLAAGWVGLTFTAPLVLFRASVGYEIYWTASVLAALALTLPFAVRFASELEILLLRGRYE